MSVRSKLKKQTRFVKTLISAGGRKPISVKKYTGDAFGPINEGLLHSRPLSKVCQNILEDLDTIFRDVPPVEEEFVVYRGVTTKHSLGVLAGFISTSYDYETALSFADDKKQCCVFIITIPVGAKVLPVEELSVNPTEGEILLPRSGYFKVTKTSYRNGMECFYLVLVLEGGKAQKEEKEHAPKKTVSLTPQQLIGMLTENVSAEEIELLGLEDAIRSAALSIERLSGTKIDEDIIQAAITSKK